jgi:hypothetical protein
MEATEENYVGLDPTDPLPTDGIPCPKCEKRFSNEIGLRMHDIRKHQPGRGWSTSRNFKGGKKTKEAELAKKRLYNARMRARFYAEGRNSRGELMPKGWKPKLNRGGNKGMKLKGWSPERREKFNSTWRSKQGKKAKKRFEPIVYPDPRQKALEQEAIQNTWPEQGNIPTLKFCPHCGENVAAWRFQP